MKTLLTSREEEKFFEWFSCEVSNLDSQIDNEDDFDEAFEDGFENSFIVVTGDLVGDEEDDVGSTLEVRQKAYFLDVPFS